MESFEEGDLISRYVESPENKHNEALADIGLESYLKMLLFDRFFHVRSATSRACILQIYPAACHTSHVSLCQLGANSLSLVRLIGAIRLPMYTR